VEFDEFLARILDVFVDHVADVQSLFLDVIAVEDLQAIAVRQVKKPDETSEHLVRVAVVAARAPALRRRVSPVQFFQEVRREMSKVTWPSWKETWLTTVMVFIMVGLTMVFFALVDFVLNYGELLLIGARRLY